MSKIRTGVIGVGSIGKNHARVMSELDNANFTAVFDAHTANAREISQRFAVKAAESLEEFASLVDAATVATPTPTHYEVAKFLMERGKHVLIEKPITEDTAHARELIEFASQRQLVLQVGHIERFNPALNALERHLTNPRFIEAHRLSPYPNRSIEIGVVLDLMIHDIEIILHLVRSPVASVDAVGIPVLSKREDIANARLRFENGCVANITASRISPERMRKIRVFQENAYLSLDYQAQQGHMFRLAESDAKESSFLQKIMAKSDATIVSEFAGRKIVREPVEVTKGEPLKHEIAAFVDCCRAGAAPKVGGHEATAALELAMEIIRIIEQQSGGN
jgi:predicted dehydrogenase